ncbi:adenosylmethionine--8-amino-7-oxononanoate transaminase [Hoyosella altamirensis]|uniref:Adenosylmethionine-8-amino-7-oxononanoate aminotransferase n=1 Tax=Hoyosella altamirensis TaxID=616997 RepID=A0A839RR08_9ACTN|nr:adenosylmethionine--8-amino-7-oxononanoate transaminase [Hoyosella altamirensis]MBB3038807.1 adenosylmethionine-8-amino-7-oxononanoate aminotransferase [Hoyosella altamirensis]
MVAQEVNEQDVVALDAQHVWHPYGAFPPSTVPLVVESASGVRLRLRDGRELIDGMSSWWAAIHGYQHPVIDEAATNQLARMSHVMFGGLTHEPAVRLAQTLVGITPQPLQKVFFADSGSVSIEVAVKMCLQYWRSLGRGEKRRLLTWRGGYHGDTFTPMSVCDPDGGMHALWTDILAEQIFAPVPPADFDLEYRDTLAALIRSHAHELAAVIVEPVVQGAGGMRFHDARYLTELRRLCDENDVLLIFDEIATGFGRTGEMFAADHANVSPDVMCVGKALTGGYLTMAAVLCTDLIAHTISAGEAGGLMHGPTFMANPLACAISQASIDLLTARDWRREVDEIEQGLRAGLAPARGLPGVRDVRIKGAIGVIELAGPVPMQLATDAAVKRGVWLRPFRNLVYTMPPFISTPDEVAQIADAMVAVCHAAGATHPEREARL